VPAGVAARSGPAGGRLATVTGRPVVR
jgi:hypothetical protein